MAYTVGARCIGKPAALSGWPVCGCPTSRRLFPGKEDQKFRPECRSPCAPAPPFALSCRYVPERPSSHVYTQPLKPVLTSL